MSSRITSTGEAAVLPFNPPIPQRIGLAVSPRPPDGGSRGPSASQCVRERPVWRAKQGKLPIQAQFPHPQAGSPHLPAAWFPRSLVCRTKQLSSRDDRQNRRALYREETDLRIRRVGPTHRQYRWPLITLPTLSLAPSASASGPSVLRQE